MARPTSSMEGFINRPTDRKVGGIIGGQQLQSEKKPDEKPNTKQAIKVQKREEKVESETPRLSRSGISRDEINASLSGIDDLEPDSDDPKKGRKPSKPKSSKRKWALRVFLVILVILVGIGGYVAFKTIIASGNVFKGSILDVFQSQPLKQDENGRSNILVLGTSEDDPGHQAGNLTDSMMIMSVDQNKKNAFLVSIPRDLYVKYGRACDSGYAGKINVYYSCVHSGNGVDADRDALTKEASFIGDIVGLDIQYGVNVNYTVMREMVNAVGGSITVDIEGDGAVPTGVKPGSVMDSNFDWKCGVGDRKVSHAQVLKRCPPNGHFIDYGPGPQKLDAEHALYLAQARGDSAPTWGLAQSNFDREKNQQKIIKALREKAVSAGVLSDFGKVSSIVDALGNNLRTTFETKEFRTLVSLAQDIKSDDIKSISLIDGDKPVMTTGNVDGQSVVEPAAGTYDYSQLRLAIAQKMSSDPVIQEAAPIAIFNGSGVAGVAQTEADKLKDDKFTVGTIGNAPKGNYAQYVLYHIGNGDAGTLAKLQQRYNIKVTSGTPPITVDSTVKFVLIIGVQPTTTSNN
jgi:anionic cell wall polymer biosynthesis LytR-Cps2A-Psr (LCP) family protein